MRLRIHPMKPNPATAGERTARAVAATALAAAAGTALALAPAAQAAPLPATAATASAPRATAPAFLAADELPPHRWSEWTAHPVARGLPDPEPFCAEGVLPEAGAAHRLFTTEFDTGATQVVVRTRSTGAAKKLAAALEKAVRGCADRVEREHPEATAVWRDYGSLDAEEGAHVLGVGTSFPESSRDAHLFGIGRDGRTVTLVAWGEMGTLDGAPVTAFRETTATAVHKLYR
ncbi:hypothetical protein [Streptomyces albus]|uniref:hypothetical protein n=1 Tax=Streptomyces albus TaxID=1888 RepID=UPI000A4152B9|nr:hypothetical protein [Streptomyces albus]